MTQIGMVTCSSCGDDKKIGGHCRCNPAGPVAIDLRGTKPEIAAGENSGLVTRAMAAARIVDAIEPGCHREAEPKASRDPSLLPLHELFRQVKVHNDRVLAILREDRSDALLPPQVVSDVEVLLEFGKWLEYSPLPGLGHELTPEQEADMEERYETDNFAQLFLRYLAHATNDTKLLARVNRATVAEKWYQLRELKSARDGLMKGRGNKGRAESMDSVIASLELELAGVNDTKPDAETPNPETGCLTPEAGSRKRGRKPHAG